MKSKLSPDELETKRYNGLIDIFSTLGYFSHKELNVYRDQFHKEINSWEDFTKGFEQDPLKEGKK